MKYFEEVEYQCLNIYLLTRQTNEWVSQWINKPYHIVWIYYASYVCMILLKKIDIIMLILSLKV